MTAKSAQKEILSLRQQLAEERAEVAKLTALNAKANRRVAQLEGGKQP